MTAVAAQPTLANSSIGKPQCSRRKWSGKKLCSRPATVLLTAMCVHEHALGPTAYCDEHAASDARTGQLACMPCHDGPEPHMCLVSVVQERAL